MDPVQTWEGTRSDRVASLPEEGLWVTSLPTCIVYCVWGSRETRRQRTVGNLRLSSTHFPSTTPSKDSHVFSFHVTYCFDSPVPEPVCFPTTDALVVQGSVPNRVLTQDPCIKEETDERPSFKSSPLTFIEPEFSPNVEDSSIEIRLSLELLLTHSFLPKMYRYTFRGTFRFDTVLLKPYTEVVRDLCTWTLRSLSVSHP